MIQYVFPNENELVQVDTGFEKIDKSASSADLPYGDISCHSSVRPLSLLSEETPPEKQVLKNFSESLLIHAIMNNSLDAIYVKDLDSKFVLNSLAHAHQFNLSDPKEMIGKCDLDYFPAAFSKQAYLDEQEIIRSGKPLVGQTQRFESETGIVTWYSASKYPMLDKDANIIGTWGTSTEITKLKQIEEALAYANNELKKLAGIDDLSGLHNRRQFYTMLNKAIKKHSESIEFGFPVTFSLVAIDIDHFKTVNDTLGHLDGDEAIRHIASILLNNCRSTDTVFRIGGDEYAILLLDTGLADAKEQSERIRKIIETTPLIRA
jgi:diguanylate cyclase (GGDEF)-like protein/PAS domain S-box-containing protein